MNATSVSLRDKIGQMLIIGFEGKTANALSAVAQAINNYNIGGVILFDYNYQTKEFDKNIESPPQVQQLNETLQELTQKANHKHNRPLLPLLISVDYEGGQINRLKTNYGFPETVSATAASAMPDEKINQIANTMAETLKNNGFNLNFIPVLDVNVNPNNPIIGQLDRSFSDNPDQVAHVSKLYVQQHQQHGIVCAYKHFPGHGSSTSDSHLGFVDVTDTWQNYELIPYQRLLSQTQSYAMIMTAHIINRQLDDSGLPATLSYKMLTELLRHELKFDGVIITDDMQMKAISDFYGLEESLTMAINAGADMFIFGNQLCTEEQDIKQVIDIIESKINMGEIKQERIEESYARIIALKQMLD